MNKKTFATKVARKAKDEAKKNLIRMVKLGMITAATVKPYVKEAMKEVKKEMTSIEKKAREEARKELKKMKKRTKVSKKTVKKTAKKKTAKKRTAKKTTRKKVEKAKGILMKQRNLSEDDAYNLIRKSSMDKRVSMKDIADAIILSFEISGK